MPVVAQRPLGNDDRPHVRRRDRTMEAFEDKRVQRLKIDHALDGGAHFIVDQSLSVFGLAAEARGEIRYDADRGIFVPAFKADASERGIAVSDADTKARSNP
jgi:hypothetical protein